MIIPLNRDHIYQSAALIMRCVDQICDLRKADQFDIINDFNRMLDSKDYWLIAYEDEGKIIGGAGILFLPWIWNKSHNRAIEVFFHVDPMLGHMKRGRVMMALLEAIENECKIRQTDTLTIGTTVGNDLDLYLERQGFRLAEKFYIKGYKP